MEFDQGNAWSDLDDPARACTRAHQGIWTLWWQYESLQSRAAELDEKADEEAFIGSRDRDIEKAIVVAEIARLTEILEANGMLVRAQAIATRLARWSPQTGTNHGEIGRPRLNRIGRSDRMTG